MQGLSSNLNELKISSRQSLCKSAKLGVKISILNIKFGTQLNKLSTSLLANDASRSDTETDCLILERLKCVKKESNQWLELVDGHFGTKSHPGMTSTDLSETSAPPTTIPLEEHFNLVYELLLLTLGLLDYSSSKESSSQFQSTSKSVLDYSALARNLILLTLKLLGINKKVLESVEKSIAQHLYFQLEQEQLKENSSSTPTSSSSSSLPPSSQLSKTVSTSSSSKSSKSKTYKWLATGTGVLLGGVALGLTGGLAAPALIPLFGSLGITAFSGAGGAVLLGTLFGVGGGGLAGYRVSERLKGIESLEFEEVREEGLPNIPSLEVVIVVSGFLVDKEDSIRPWMKSLGNSGKDVFSLKADTDTFLAGGKALDNFIRNKIIRTGSTELIKRSILAAVYAGVALPLSVVSTAGMLFDSDFSRCHDKAIKAGDILADVIHKRIQGNRPITLIGYGPGATTIFQSLLTLSTSSLYSSSSTLLLIDSIILISLPISPSIQEWKSIRSIVNGKVINCFSKNDWVLGVCARVFGLVLSPAGLGLNLEVEEGKGDGVEGVEDWDIGDLVEGGHLTLRDKIGTILERVGV